MRHIHIKIKMITIVNAFILLTFIFSANNIFASKHLISDDMTERCISREFENGRWIRWNSYLHRALKCEVEKCDLLPDAFILRIEHKFNRRCDIFSEKDVHLLTMGVRGIRHDIEKHKLARIKHFSVKDTFLPDENNLLMKAKLLISKKFFIAIENYYYKNSNVKNAYFEYQIMLNNELKKSSSNHKYLFVLKDTDGNIKLKKSFNGAEFVIKLYSKDASFIYSMYQFNFV